MATTQEFMDKTDWVERYSWFGAMPDPVISPVNSLVDKKGSITPLGKQYIGELSRQDNDASAYQNLRLSIRTDYSWSPTDSSDTVDTYPQIGMGRPGVVPPLSIFRTLGRVIASIGIAVVVAVLAFY